MARRALTALALVVLAWPGSASGQQLERCEAGWLDVDHVRAILQVELADHWDRSIEETVVRFEDCASEQPRVVLTAPGAEPTTLTLRLGRVSDRARTRLVALVIAELLRTRASEEPSQNSPVPPPPEAAQPEAAQAEAAAPEPAAPPPPEAAPPEPEEPARPEALAASAGALALASPSTDAATRDTAATGTAATDTAATDAAATDTPSPSPWWLGASVGGRFFFEHLTLAALVEATLRFDRLLITVAGAGAQLTTRIGAVHLAQLTAGVGVRMLEHHGTIRVGWDLRGEAGGAMADGEQRAFDVIASTSYTWVLAASTRVEVVWPIGPIELGFTTDVGYQRGIVERNAFGHAGLAGVFASLGVSVGWVP